MMPTISRGQVWKNRETGGYVTVADFAEYTAGWFVRVEEYMTLFHEPHFRATYQLVSIRGPRLDPSGMPPEELERLRADGYGRLIEDDRGQ
jgi:hypothetical protein